MAEGIENKGRRTGMVVFWRSDRFEAACVPIADIDARKRRMKTPPHKWLAQPKVHNQQAR